MGSDLEPDVRNEATDEIRPSTSTPAGPGGAGLDAPFALDEGLRRTIAWYRSWLARTA